jgi:hypothetical protein
MAHVAPATITRVRSRSPSRVILRASAAARDALRPSVAIHPHPSRETKLARDA